MKPSESVFEIIETVDNDNCVRYVLESPPAGEMVKSRSREALVLLAKYQDFVSLLCIIYLHPTQI